MQGLIERTYQALGIGDFKPTSLQAHDLMLTDCKEYNVQLKRLEKAVKAFQTHTSEFLTEAGGFLTHAPFPRQWRNVDLTSPPTALHTPVPKEHAALFAAPLHAELAERLPSTLALAIDAELLRPLQLWLEAFQAAEDRMGPLQALRLRYDSARRTLAPLFKQAATAGGAEAADAPEAAAARMADAHRRLAEEEAKHAEVLAEFKAEERAAWEHLAWLVNDAARLKALVAATLRAIGDIAAGRPLPSDLLEPFPVQALRGKELQALKQTALEAAPAPTAVAVGAVTRPPAEELPSDRTAVKTPVEETALPSVPLGAKPPAGDSARESVGIDAEGRVEDEAAALDREPSPYEGGGSGAVESRLSEDAVHYGLGARERKLSEKMGSPLARARSGPTPEEAYAAKGKELALAPSALEGAAAPAVVAQPVQSVAEEGAVPALVSEMPQDAPPTPPRPDQPPPSLLASQLPGTATGDGGDSVFAPSAGDASEEAPPEGVQAAAVGKAGVGGERGGGVEGEPRAEQAPGDAGREAVGAKLSGAVGAIQAASRSGE